jgi:uridine kinase
MIGEDMNNFVIGIAGGTSSGKTTITERISDNYNEDVVVFKLDDYYKDQSHKTLEERKIVNYDHPDAFDFDLYIEHLKLLIKGEQIEKPIYDYSINNRVGTKIVQPKKIIIVEGILIFEKQELLDLLDYKIFVSASSDIRFIRRLQRDTKERGRTIDGVINQYLSSVKPMHDLYIEPNKKYADIVVLNNDNFQAALQIILATIGNLIEKKGVKDGNK